MEEDRIDVNEIAFPSRCGFSLPVRWTLKLLSHKRDELFSVEETHVEFPDACWAGPKDMNLKVSVHKVEEEPRVRFVMALGSREHETMIMSCSNI